MANLICMGMQWGDEGKGKIVDLICPAFDVVVRYQGGNNAGHTVKFGDRHFALHLIPSGILHAGIRCVLGNGMVIDPEALFKEIDELKKKGFDPAGNLFVSERAQLLLPVHVGLDQARETARGETAIGTTVRGIGPAYEMKAARLGLRLCDLFSQDLEDALRAQLRRVEVELSRQLSDRGPHLDQLVARCGGWRERLQPYLHDTSRLLNDWIDEGRSVLLEGAQGTLLDVDHGTYPFVTSSNPTAGGACVGAGIPPTRIDGTLGVLKAYCTRVGGGPFPTEQEGTVAEHVRRRGNEFGTTTGRPRRCGWLDVVAARYSRRLNGVEMIALTKLDVLDELEEIPVCIGYRHKGHVLPGFPADWRTLGSLEPIYRTLKGWQEPTAGALDYADLPQRAQHYIEFIEEWVEAPVTLISSGPRREETIVRQHPSLERLTSGRLSAVLEQRSAS